ncbi:MAG: UvrD-helicase domain-containing protein [Candidatus Eremiobacteraeota bacterium]|nr:UvrD-helicase domain-containing protein [Candidatus Eremiobacteraeota bacterium]
MNVFITGSAGTGKTELLVQSIRSAKGAAIVLSPSQSSVLALRERAAALNATFSTVDELAMRTLREHASASGLDTPLETIDDVVAGALFERAAAPLLTLEWTEFVEAQLDPEVPGLRMPHRFLEAAFRLIRKLRDARIAPADFLKSALAGAASFYGNPPNLAHPDLLYYTKDAYRDSLNAGAAELERQYRREVDLAKILAKLYDSYLAVQVRSGCLTPRDAVAEAERLLVEHPEFANELRGRWPHCFIDDAQELTLGELTFLQHLFGETLPGVTLAADAESCTSTFRGARPDRVFALPGERVERNENHRSPAALEAACRHLAGADPRSATPDQQTPLVLFRATTPKAEAQFITDRVVDLLDSGTRPSEIALIFRSVANVRLYEEALLERNVSVQVVGDVNLFNQPEALDALALLWNVYDPYRHEWLLRTLSGRAMMLSDATVFALCNEPTDGQTLLFEEEEARVTTSGHWDPKRDIRLGWNVLHGDQDLHIAAPARERLAHFRALRERWRAASKVLALPELARLIWSEGLASAGAAGSARARHQIHALARLLSRIEQFADSHQDANLGAFLLFAEERAKSDFESCENDSTEGAVELISIEAVRGREFQYVVVPNAKAGSFPRWYVPDAFLYSPSLGMIAKENVGEALASRTAKFSYYMFRTKARESYNREERRAFIYALRRASVGAVVTASERATRGLTAPEFLEELRAARIPGAVDETDRWRPSRSVFAGAVSGGGH